MTDETGVTQATLTARKVVLSAFVATAVLIGALALERMRFQRANLKAVNDIKSAIKISDTILLEDERLTMSANLAATSGDARWVARYESRLPSIDSAITAAKKLAPPGSALRFDQATRVANDQLVELEREAFRSVALGDLQTAQRVLNSPAYAEKKDTLKQGSDVFMAELQAAVDDHLDALIKNAWALVVSLLALATLFFAMLWRHLTRHLLKAEAAFAAKQSEVTRLAMYDTLTGLANRRFLHVQLESSIARAAREASKFALLVIDLDGFKPINDRLGHAAGDAVLIEVGRRLTEHVRAGEFAARLGGDEFVLVLHQNESCEGPDRAAQRLIAAISGAVCLPQGDVRVSASVGIALYPGDSAEADDLIRKADVALYRAKNEARGEARFFQQSMDEDVRLRQSLELDLRTAIAVGEIEPYFQPLIGLSDGRLIGFEALARWNHPIRGTIPPLVFVPIAEESGQIDALTVCVMRAALLAARDWHPSLTIAINIAPQQLKNEALTERLLDVLRETQFPPQRFEIEITENALIGDLDMARRIVLGLKKHGIRVALDDFGTGYSSLSHLSELPFDKIKIDRSFIHTMRKRRESATIVNAIIGLGRSLNLPTTAEGIESSADAEMLAQLGCTVGQGYLYSKPVPAGEVPKLIASNAESCAVN